MNAVLYQAVARDVARDRLPPDVLALCVERPCAGCRAPLLCVASVLALSVEATARAGRPLLIVCEACYRGSAPAPAGEIYIHDQDLQRRLDRHQAEKN